MTITGHLVRVDRSHENIPLPDTDMLDALHAAIGCRTIDIVSLDNEVDVVVDDEGLLTAEPRLNIALTNIVHALGGTNVIFGNGILVSASPEGETISLTDEQYATVAEILEGHVDEDVTQRVAQTLKAAFGPFAAALVLS